MPKQSPVRGAIYTLTEIEKNLKLLDTPCLLVFIPTNGFHPIQNTHFLVDDILAIKEWAESKWEYSHTTNEWIPVFRAVDSESIRNLCSVSESKYEYANDGDMWIVPKAFPREEI